TGTFTVVGVTLEIWHSHPCSTSHVAEQPSPSTLFPSSQASGLSASSPGRRKPSPHAEVQAAVAPPPLGRQPGSISHRGEQPSPLFTLPSSQRSPKSTTPSLLHTSGGVKHSMPAPDSVQE